MKNYDFIGMDIVEKRRMVMNGPLVGFVDEQGNEVIPTIYKKATNFKDGYSIVVDDTNNLGVINIYGKKIIPNLYIEIQILGNGFFKVKQSIGWDTYAYGVLDCDNYQVLPIKKNYSLIKFYEEYNLFVVNDHPHGKIIIDENGRILTKSAYKSIVITDSHHAEVEFNGVKGIISF